MNMEVGSMADLHLCAHKRDSDTPMPSFGFSFGLCVLHSWEDTRVSLSNLLLCRHGAGNQPTFPPWLTTVFRTVKLAKDHSESS